MIISINQEMFKIFISGIIASYDNRIPIAKEIKKFYLKFIFFKTLYRVIGNGKNNKKKISSSEIKQPLRER